MKVLVALAAVMIVSAPARAVSPRTWTTATAEEFMAGDLEQIGLTSSGSLVPAPAVSTIATVPDPFVLSQAVDPSGRRYIGTGNNGRVYRVEADGSLKLLFTAAEPEIYALVVSGGQLYAASSPWGAIYRVDINGGSATSVWKSEQAYIWALAPTRGNELLAATGLEGAIYRVDTRGSATQVWKAPESHVRSMALLADGSILAGGSGEGRIYRVSPEGKAIALFDSQLSEISAVAWAAGQEHGWAAAAAGALPAAPPQRTENRQQSSSGSSQESDDDQETGTVDVSISFDSGTTATPTPLPASTVGSELYRIHEDGFVELIRKFDKEIIYSLQPSQRGVLVGTGPDGRIYEVTARDVTLIGSAREKQVVSIDRDSDGYVATTTNAGAVLRLTGSRPAESGHWTSPARDAAIFSQWGSWSVGGQGLSPQVVRLSFRSGNSAKPDETWSEWSVARGTEGNVEAPPARYLQYRVTFTDPTSGARIDRVSVSYMQRNTAPVVESIVVHDPGVVYLTGAAAASNQIVEATNPDEYGIFSSLDAPREQNGAGRRVFRKAYRTIAWKARDDNADTMTYDVAFRPSGGTAWLRLRDNILESQVNFDTSQLPDGEYEVRVSAHDRKDNPETGLTTLREGAWFTVDNSPSTVRSARDGDQTRVTIRDTASPVMRVEMAVDAKEWVRLVPDDGIPDSKEETFTIDTPANGAFVMIRAVDAHYNVTTARVTAP